jgi:hypothetical protein
MQPVMERLNPVLRGWMAYFRLSEVKKCGVGGRRE